MIYNKGKSKSFKNELKLILVAQVNDYLKSFTKWIIHVPFELTVKGTSIVLKKQADESQTGLNEPSESDC